MTRTPRISSPLRLLAVSTLWIVAGLVAPAVAVAESTSPTAAAPTRAGALGAGAAPLKSAASPVTAPPAPATSATKPAAQINANAAAAASAPVAAPGAAAAGAATAAGVESPQVGPLAAAPKPATELEQMKVLEGSWRCDGRAPATPSAPEHAYRSTWKFKRDLDNFWWAAEYQQVKAKANPAPLKARGFLTYDSVTKSFTMMGVDNAGGSTHEISSGWNGDVVTLAGDASLAGKKVPFREVITKKGDREFTWRGEMKVGGDWMTLGEDRCRK
jgi:hypothetical protein